MNEFSNQTINAVFDRGTARLISDLRLINCEFVNCALSLTKDIQRRTKVSNVVIVNCRANGCHIGPAIFEDITVDGLQTNDLLEPVSKPPEDDH